MLTSEARRHAAADGVSTLAGLRSGLAEAKLQVLPANTTGKALNCQNNGTG